MKSCQSLRAHYHHFFTGQLDHVDQLINHQGGARTNFSSEIQKITRIKKIPLTIIVPERVSIDCERAGVISTNQQSRIIERPLGEQALGHANLVEQTNRGR